MVLVTHTVLAIGIPLKRAINAGAMPSTAGSNRTWLE